MEAFRANSVKDERRLRRLVRCQWYSELKLILATLEGMPDKIVLHDDDLHPLKIRASNLPLEMENPLDFGPPRFFTPFTREYLHTSSCTLFSPDDRTHKWRPPPEDPGDLFYYDRGLAFNIDQHVCLSMFEYGYPWGWKQAPLDTRRYKGIRYGGGYMGGRHGENPFMVDLIVDQFSHRTPHLMLVMTSDHTGDSGLLRSEMIVMVSFMISRFRSKRYRRHVVQPILIVSVLQTHQIRILQGHFDGQLNIRCSETIGCCNPNDHEEVMNLVVRWLMSKPCRGTDIRSFLPGLLADASEPPEGDRRDQRPQATLAIRAAA